MSVWDKLTDRAVWKSWEYSDSDLDAVKPSDTPEILADTQGAEAELLNSLWDTARRLGAAASGLSKICVWAFVVQSLWGS